MVTLRLYRDGLAEGLWRNIPWLDAILARAQPGESLAQVTLDYLDPSFTDPTDGLFSLSIVSRELERVRETIRQSPPPDLANLGRILRD